jgi:cation:H+ antiporter
MGTEMELIVAIAILAAGLVILWKAADIMVAGAVGLAKQLGISPLVIGLTIVAMGTSAPEVAASIAAVLRGMPDIAVGNVYGSNIANLALVGGLVALCRPITVQKSTLCREIPVMLAAALLLWPVLCNLQLARAEAILLLVVFVVLIGLTAYYARREASERQAGQSQQPTAADALVKNLIFCAIGLVGLALGAELGVRGAVVIGKRAGLSDAVIGLTIIAIGTSLPELATSLVAAIKGQHDISVGNLVGSNIFNTLLVMGTAGTIRPFVLSSRLMGPDYWVMIGVSVCFTLVALVGRRTIGRLGGVVLLGCYVAYLAYLLTAGK